MEATRNAARNLVLVFGAAVVSLLLIRLALELLGANSDHAFVELFYAFTNPLISPFTGIADPNLSAPLSIILPQMVGLVAYILVFLIVADFVYGIIGDDPITIVVNIVDSLLKVLEFLLISRLVFKIFGVMATGSSFVNTVYSSTDWVQGILPTIPFSKGIIELSTIIVFVIIIFLDVTLENLVDNYRKHQEAGTPGTRVVETHHIERETVKEAQPATPPNITINVISPPHPANNMQPPRRIELPPSRS